MSDPLFVEFYDESAMQPARAVVFCHFGGDNPEDASEALADFLLHVSDLSGLDWRDASALATRLILYQQAFHYGASVLDSLAVSLFPQQSSYPGQLVRIFCKGDGPRVEFVRDAYTKPCEVSVAHYVLARAGFNVGSSL